MYDLKSQKCISRGNVTIPKEDSAIKKLLGKQKTKVVKGGASSMSKEPTEN